MKVGLFLNIDGVCIVEAVNLQYAKILGIKNEQQELANLFNTNQISTAEFSRRLVTSFRGKRFTKQ